MIKIAIVTAFSEQCYELCRQFIVSCWQAIKQTSINAEYSFICYECNYNIKEKKAVPFRKSIALVDEIPIEAAIIQYRASEIEWSRVLSDIVVYHNFAEHHLDDFDYVFFCHDDIYIRPGLIFREVFDILNDPNYNLVAEVAVACNKDISVRFRPSFIATRSDKFRQANLSFINEHQILTPECKRYDITIDGGAELLASYYSNNNTTPGRPFTKFPSTWFRHLRINSDYGVEIHNLLSPNDRQVQKLLTKAKKYSDYYLYGQTNDN